MATPFTIPALHDELFLDPVSIGYASALAEGNQNALESLVNHPRNGGAYQVDRDPVTPSDVFLAIDPNDFTVLTVTELARLQVILTVPRIDLRAPSVRTMVASVFAQGSPTRQTLAQLQKRAGSRAEVLWGPGEIVTLNQIDQALQLV